MTMLLRRHVPVEVTMRRAALTLALLCACHGGPDDVCIPQIYHPSSLSVNEGATITFDLSLAPASECDASGYFEFSPQTNASMYGGLHADPTDFTLTRAARDGRFSLRADLDIDNLDEIWTMIMYIPGTIDNESPETIVNVIDTPAPPP